MFLKKLLPYETKFRSRLFLQRFKKLDYFKAVTRKPSKKYAFVFLAADYGNLGDIAITYAQTKFIQDHSDLEVLEIPISRSMEGLHFVRGIIQPGDVVTTVGGGNLGELYNQIEFIRQLVVKFFPNNKIISFPQTFDFNEEKPLSIAKKVYGSHQDLHFVAREAVSYQLMKEHFTNNHVLLTPDIVLSLCESKKEKRKGALICMRNDKEKKLTSTQKTAVEDLLQSKYKTVGFYDTHLHRNGLSVAERNDELRKIWNAFASSELVVTDRLHGMIFCYITHTPCVVFPNNNHKIKGVYEWIKGRGNVVFLEEFKEESLVRSFTEVGIVPKEPISLTEKFQPLINILN